MVINKNSSFGVVKKSVEIAVIQNKPRIFLYYLLAKNVSTTFPNKLSFYAFFKAMVDSAYRGSKGPLSLIIETPKWENQGFSHYCFYDKVHKHNRIYIKLKESEETLFIDMLPF